MRVQKFLVAMALAGPVVPLLLAAQEDLLTTAFFEKHGVAPRSAAKLRATIVGRTLSIKQLQGGALERVYYGARRIDTKGVKTHYQIVENAIKEEPGGTPRLLLIYEWQGHTYICLENVGDLDELGIAEGTCPYEIVAADRGNLIGGKSSAAPKGP